MKRPYTSDDDTTMEVRDTSKNKSVKSNIENNRQIHSKIESYTRIFGRLSVSLWTLIVILLLHLIKHISAISLLTLSFSR